MPKWTKPSEGLPEVEAGERVIVIIERNGFFRAIVLEASLTAYGRKGWSSVDRTFAGYTPEDGILWTTEKDLCGIAAAMKEAGEL